MLDMLDSHAHVTHFAQEAERGRIARKLHDSAVQSLTALIADLEYFRTRHLPVNAETREEVGAMYEKWQGLAQESLGLVSAIRAVYNGEQDPVPGTANRVVQLLDNRQKADKGQCNDGLTSREMETLVLVARGMVAKEIARVLAISEKTVRNHIGNIYRKLDIYDRSQVVIYAMKKGLVDLNEV
jgi:DNA-binding CsgD family transcriptional regulator